MQFFAYSPDRFLRLLQEARLGHSHAKVLLRLAVNHTKDFNRRRDGQWVLTYAQLQQVVEQLPDFSLWLRQIGIVDQTGCIRLNQHYFEDTVVCVQHNRHLQLPLAIKDNLLVSECWREDVDSGFYSATSTMREWLEAFAGAGVPLNHINGLLAVIQPQQAGLLYETQMLNGLCLMGTVGEAGPIVQLIPDSFELSFAQFAAVAGKGALELESKLVQALAEDNFKLFGEQAVMYVAKVKVYESAVRRRFDKALYQPELAQPLYQPMAKQAEWVEPLEAGTELVILGKYHPQAEKIGLDVVDHRHAISPEIYQFGNRWMNVLTQMELDPYSPEQREWFNGQLSRMVKQLQNPVAGHLKWQTGAKFIVQEVYTLQALTACYQVYNDGRAAQAMLGAQHPIKRFVTQA